MYSVPQATGYWERVRLCIIFANVNGMSLDLRLIMDPWHGMGTIGLLVDSVPEPFRLEGAIDGSFGPLQKRSVNLKGSLESPVGMSKFRH